MTRWGIMGTGGIAASLADAISAEGAEVVAVSSASEDRARTFAEDRGIARWYGDHHGLVADPDGIDVVYVATTSERHHLDAAACIEAGVPVLVEKPFALDVPRAAAVLEAAQAAGVLVVEAMWMRVQPGFQELQRRIAAGQIGEPRMVHADFGIAAEPDRTRRWFARELGGGALLDVGIYPLTLAVSLLGAPTEVTAIGELVETGVDANVAVAMRHPTGLSSWNCSFVADTGIEATVSGPGGSLRLHGDFHNSARLSLRQRSTVIETVEIVGHDLGYRHEVREVHRCLAEGLTESPALPHELTLEVLAVLDEIRGQLGVEYPADDPDAATST